MPGADAGDLAGLVEWLNSVARSLSDDGLPVRYLRSTYVPDDETCFHYVDASTASAAERFAERAQISFDRILEAKNAAVGIANDPKEER